MLLRNRCSLEKKSFARHLRRNQTPAEDQLWQMLRAKRLGHRFHRQAVIRGYIADFYCPAAKLVVEADGENHDAEKDAIRDRNMGKLGLLVLRFGNEEILCKSLWVIAAIERAMRHRLESSTASTADAQSDQQAKSRRERTSLGFPLIHTSGDGYGVSIKSLKGCKGSVFVSEEIAQLSANHLGKRAYRCKKGHWHVS